MNREPIHKNLSTSFVDLEALVNHLKDLQFIGSVHIELSSYDAEIIFTAPQNILVRDIDHLTGRTAYGTAALKRIYERVREPFGRIHVYRSKQSSVGGKSVAIHIDESILARARMTLVGKSDTPAFNFLSLLPVSESPDYSKLVADLLTTVQMSLRNAQLDFPEAFRNTCSSLSAVYPFLHPRLGAVRFGNDVVELDIRVTAKQFTDALVEILGVILSRVSELASRPGAMESVRKDLQEFAVRRESDLKRFGLIRLQDWLHDR